MDKPERSTSWHWWVSSLLLLATMINYMDRQTLSNVAPRVKEQFSLNNEQYGDIEFLFGVSFAVGSLFFGVIADRFSIRILYPAILVAWSAVGIATGLTQGYASLMICRGLLGFFESGHWPCALIVTQAVMSRSNRAMGNSILQSGASLGAVMTPIIIRFLVSDSTSAEAWRLPFFVIGGFGLLWVVLWLIVIKPTDLDQSARAAMNAAHVETSVSQDRNERQQQDNLSTIAWLAQLVKDRRFWALVFMVIAINTSWQLVRAWLPLFLQKGRGYSEVEALYFNSTYFIATDVGCIAAGVAALWLTKIGLSVHRSRAIVFFACACLAAMTSVAAFLPQGWLLLCSLLAVAAGTLGVFPCYYSFTQELSSQYMGRLTGLFSFTGWMVSSPTNKLFGYVVDRTNSYDLNMAILGWAPMLGLIAFLILWPKQQHEQDA